MSDEADQAQPHIERAVEIALKELKHDGPSPTGYCHNCDAPLAGELRFCDADCRDDWQKRRTLNLHHG